MKKFFGLFKRQNANVVENEGGCNLEELDKASMISKHFFCMNKQIREEAFEYAYSQSPETEKEEFYFNEIKNSRKDLTYDYFISTLEPSVVNDAIYYKEGQKVAFGRKLGQWRKLASEFYPQFNTRLTLPAELFLFYTYRLAQNKWTKYYVFENSKDAGNYWDSPRAKHGFEKTGARKVAGFADGIGNTSKICYKSGIYYVCGGYCGKSGDWSVAGHIDLCNDSSVEFRYASPVITVL